MASSILERAFKSLPSWQTRGECRSPRTAILVGQGKVNFFPHKGQSAGMAKLICAECPVRQECLQYALDHPELVGIWGGTTTGTRRRMRAQAVAA